MMDEEHARLLSDLRDEHAAMRQDLQVAQNGWLSAVTAIGDIKAGVTALRERQHVIFVAALVCMGVMSAVGGLTMVLLGLKVIRTMAGMFTQGQLAGLW